MKKLRQNILLLVISVSFFAVSFAMVAENVKTANGLAVPTPTPKKKTSPTATPKKVGNTTNSNKSAKTNSNSKANSNKAGSNVAGKSNANTKSNSNSAKKTNSNSKSTANTAKTNSNLKTNSKANSSTKSNSNSKGNSNSSAKSNVNSKANANKTTPTVVSDLPQVIVNTTSAKVRTQPNSSSAELRRAKLGSTFTVLERKSSWYRIQYSAGGKTLNGWLPSTAVDDFDAGSRDEIYRQIVERYYSAEGMNFAIASELFEFLNGLKSSGADWELKKLLSLRQALKNITQSPDKTQREFLKNYEKNIVYSEPSGEWYVRSELLWDLYKKHKNEEIAWEAAKNPLAGECEGYVNCYLFTIRTTDGEYLSLYPTGKYSTEALNNITNMLEPIVADLQEKTVYVGPTDLTDRAEFNRILAELRSIISRLQIIEKDKPLRQIDQIAEAFR